LEFLFFKYINEENRRLFIFPFLFNYMDILKITNSLIQIFTKIIYNNIQLSSFSLKMLVPCFVLSEDSLFSRIEYVLFLDVESKVTFFITFHDDHELVTKSSVQRKLFRRLH
jgi:hypothetical protein